MRSTATILRTAAVLALLAGTPIAFADQVITVDITDADVIDVPGTATIADLPGPDGHVSFTEAMIASNNTPGRQTIAFNIPQSQWTYLSFLYPGRAVVHGMMNEAIAYQEVTIDGTTQTAFTGDTNPDGREVVIIRGGGLYIPASNCILRGLDNTSVYIEGSNALVEDTSMMGIDIYGGLGGANSLVRNNVGGGTLKIDQSANNVVVGSTFTRVRVLGWAGGGLPAVNNRIGGPAPQDANVILGLGTRNSQGIPSGYAVQLFDTVGTVIENNRIGTTTNGLAQGHPLTTMGVYFDGNNVNTTIRDNLIAGVLAIALPPHAPAYPVGTGIQLYGTGSGVDISGNDIGLNAAGDPVLGSVTGISITNYSLGSLTGIRIGSDQPGGGNRIAGHQRAGISVGNAYTGVRISGNALFANGGLGIDLINASFAEGVTPNDATDADTGANTLQNFPVLNSAATVGSGVGVAGTLTSTPSSAFSVEFFASPACDPTGHGEGARFLGATGVTTSAAGAATFDVTLAAPVLAGEVITATAIRTSTGDTSEFSACITVTGPTCPADFNHDGTTNSTDVSDFINQWFADQLDGTLVTDWDHNGVVNSTDVSDFINAWFDDIAAGCG